MANAIVIGMRGSDRDPAGGFTIIVSFLLYGDDVDADMEGRPIEVPVNFRVGFDLLDFKNNIVAAVRGRALEIGITVAAGDLDMPSYESG